MGESASVSGEKRIRVAPPAAPNAERTAPFTGAVMSIESPVLKPDANSAPRSIDSPIPAASFPTVSATRER